MNHDEPPWYDLLLRPWHVLEIGRSRFWWQWWCQLLGFAWPCRWKWCATSQWWLKLAMRKQEKFVPLGLPQSWHILTYHDTMSTCTGSLLSFVTLWWLILNCSRAASASNATMSGGDCNRTHQNSHRLQWSKSWAWDIQWPCRWSQLYCHPDLFSDFMSLTERSLLRPCSCLKHREIFSCMCFVCKKSRNLPKCGAKDWGSCRVCHWPYKHSASPAVDDVSTGPKRGQAQSDIIWYIYNYIYI